MKISINSHEYSLLDALTAFGPIILGVIAIWNRQIRSYFVRPKFGIQLHNIRGDVTLSGGYYFIYYHLKVVNLRPWLPISKCRVLLKGYSILQPDGQFKKIPMPVPFQFCWAPKDNYRVVTITKEKVFDFFIVSMSGSKAIPALYETPNNFQGAMDLGETMRYELEVTSGNSYGDRTFFFEVAWQGTWTGNPDTTTEFLKIKALDHKTGLIDIP